MRVHIYPPKDEVFVVLIEPSLGRGLPPVLLQNLTRENVPEAVLRELTRIHRPAEPE